MTEVHSIYPVSIRWERDHVGLASSSDALPPLQVGTPPGFGGPGQTWSPEHLFVLAAASCWMTMFIAIAQASKIEYRAIACTATGTLERAEDRRFWISKIVLRPSVAIVGEDALDRAGRVVEKVERACLISNSMRSEIVVEPTITVAARNVGSAA